MAKLNLSDQEILKHYKERKQVLNNELRRIETILNALGNETSSVEETKKRRYTRRNSANTTKGPGRPRAAKSGVAKAATAGIAKAAPKATSKTRGPGRPKVTKTAKAAASQKAPQATWDDKIKQALGKIGPAEKDNIVKFIADHDPFTTADKARKALTLRLAVMEKRGTLKKSQEGDQLQYRLS